MKPLTFRATDTGSLFVEQDVLFTVNAVNDTPTVEATIPDQTLAEDFTSYTIDLNAAFADTETADNALVYSVSGNTNINVSIASGNATITPTANWNGSETLTFRATDTGGLFVEQTVLFTVNAVNDAPAATNLNDDITYNISDTSVELNNIVITDLDNGEEITATLTLVNVDAGSLSTTGSATYDAVTGKWTIKDTVANVNSALANVSFIPANSIVLDSDIKISIEDGKEDGVVALLGSLTITANPVVEVVPEVTTPTTETETTPPDEEPEENPVEAVIPEVETETNVVEETEETDERENIQLSQDDESLALLSVLDVDSDSSQNDNTNINDYKVNTPEQNDSSSVRLRENMIAFNDPLSLIKSDQSFIMKLNDMREVMQLENENTEKIIGGSLTVSAGFSVGYVVWLARSGVIMSSVLSSMPAWRFVDPLPVLASLRMSENKDDEESLESIVGEKYKDEGEGEESIESSIGENNKNE